ncbi:MAG: ABC transporter ATP-binding protein [Oscillospiraceae bacterium]|nr:ABC transporter ATP-binding protein [Oscillospiraceae bacterium]
MTLSARGISKKYGKKMPEALSGVSMEITAGGVFAIVGPAKSGKSTIAEILAAVEKPTSGECLLDGMNIHKKHKKYHRGYVPQYVQLEEGKDRTLQGWGGDIKSFPPSWTLTRFIKELSGATTMESGGRPDEAYAQKMMRMVGLEEDANSALAGFSVGMVKRFAILIASWCSPSVLILDEPYNGLDPEFCDSLNSYLTELAKTRIVIFSTETIAHVESTATHLAVMNKGRLAFGGTVAEFTKDTEGDVRAAYNRLTMLMG